MGLLSILRKMRGKDKKESRVLFLGLDNSGKTTLLKFIAGETPDRVQPTEGFNVKSVQKNDVQLNMWDIGGQKKIRLYWKQYLKETDVLVYVVDSSDDKRLDESGQEFNDLLLYDELVNVPVLVFANKQDLSFAKPPSEVADRLGLLSLHDRSFQIQPCSALTGEGVQDGMEWALKAVGSK